MNEGIADTYVLLTSRALFHAPLAYELTRVVVALSRLPLTHRGSQGERMPNEFAHESRLAATSWECSRTLILGLAQKSREEQVTCTLSHFLAQKTRSGEEASGFCLYN